MGWSTRTAHLGGGGHAVLETEGRVSSYVWNLCTSARSKACLSKGSDFKRVELLAQAKGGEETPGENW